jgi:hypothetical protein
MVSITSWIVENWQLAGAVLVLLIVLSLTGRIKRLLRDARKGLADIFTLEGFFIFMIFIYIIYQIYLKVAATL